MRVLITGGAGQLGMDMALELEEEYEVVPVDIRDFDITELHATIRGVESVNPGAVVHCAALTDVDACEGEEDVAYLVNAIGARNVAIASQRVKARLVHISTDYVFDGQKGGAYREDDRPNPMTVYGKTKLMGERFVKQHVHEHFILRIAWLYGLTGKNFVKTILQAAQTKSELRVVNDQHGTPTWTADVARQVRALLRSNAFGVYHATSHGSCTWFEFAKTILMEAGVDTPVVPVATSEYPRSAPRPRNSVLDNHLLRIQGLDVMPPWQTSLSRFLHNTSSWNKGRE